MLNKKYLVYIPGIILAFVLYTISQGLNNVIGIELLGYDKSPISTAMIAIIFGMILGNIFQIRKNFLKGLDFTQNNILKLGEEMHKVLDQSARNRTMGDVPICTMLSGGIDSVLTTFYVLKNLNFKGHQKFWHALPLSLPRYPSYHQD